MFLFDVGELLLDLLEFFLMGFFFVLHEGFQLLLPIFLPLNEILLLLSPKRLFFALEGTHLIFEQRFNHMFVDLVLVVALQLGLEFVPETVGFEFFFDDSGDLSRTKITYFLRKLEVRSRSGEAGWYGCCRWTEFFCFGCVFNIICSIYTNGRLINKFSIAIHNTPLLYLNSSHLLERIIYRRMTAADGRCEGYQFKNS